MEEQRRVVEGHTVLVEVQGSDQLGLGACSPGLEGERPRTDRAVLPGVDGVAGRRLHIAAELLEPCHDHTQHVQEQKPESERRLE